MSDYLASELQRLMELKRNTRDKHESVLEQFRTQMENAKYKKDIEKIQLKIDMVKYEMKKVKK